MYQVSQLEHQIHPGIPWYAKQLTTMEFTCRFWCCFRITLKIKIIWELLEEVIRAKKSTNLSSSYSTCSFTHVYVLKPWRTTRLRLWLTNETTSSYGSAKPKYDDVNELRHECYSPSTISLICSYTKVDWKETNCRTWNAGWSILYKTIRSFSKV